MLKIQRYVGHKLRLLRPFSTITTQDGLQQLLEQVQNGTISTTEANNQIRNNLNTEALGGYALIDHHRTLRSMPQVAWWEGVV